MTDKTADDKQVEETINQNDDSGDASSAQKVKVEVVDENKDNAINLEISKLKARIAELEDQALRVRAEHENSRKAIYKESDKRAGIAVKKVVTKFLTIMGAFNQGIQSAQNAPDISGVINGMKMIESMFTSALTELEVLEVNAEPGTPLDPSVHMAISKQESSEFATNTIVSVVAKGYTYQGLLLQPAMVIVSA